ncbi:MAG TPA: orotidine-5'-phosphate decarboxylase [Gemmatimonadaceae bacterium]|nr:orotidine-5'-phosphate decarboxylase [Gemmatimonadaceae bacterium]
MALKARAIVALDLPNADAARALVERLGPACDFVKIGSELFVAEGPHLVREQHQGGRQIFLDLKLHDIPNTVRAAARSAARLGVRLLTVHGSGGMAMVEAAVEGAGEGVGVMVVTILTSLDAPALAAAWGRPRVDVCEEVLRLAHMARAAGAHGVVCSGAEAAAVHAEHGDALAVLVPGIRLSGGAAYDQARIASPRAAIEAGARYLVVGRAVTEATDPAATLLAIRREMEEAVQPTG